MEKQALDFLLRYADWIKDATFFSYIWQWFIMALIKGFYRIARFTEDVMDQVFKVTGFLNDGIVGEVYRSMRILSISLLTVTLIYILYKFLFSDRIDLKGSMLRAVLFLCIIVQLPALIDQGMDITKKTFDATKDLQGEESSLSYSIVRNNMADLSYLSRNGFELLDSTKSTDNKMNLSEEAFINTDMTEVLTPSEVSSLKSTAKNEENTAALEYKLVTDENGELKAQKIKNGWFSVFNDGKFRFKANSGTILISLLTISAVFLFSAYTIGVSIIELVFAKLLFPVLAVTDIETGQKTKQMGIDILNTFVTIMLTGLTVSLFGVYFSFLNTINLNFAAYAILCLVGINMSIAGPRTFGRYLGVDVGSSGGLRALMGGYFGAKAIKNMGSAAVDTAQNIAQAPTKIKNGVAAKLSKDMKSVNKAADLGKDMLDAGKNTIDAGVTKANNHLDKVVDDIFEDKPPGETGINKDSKPESTNINKDGNQAGENEDNTTAKDKKKEEKETGGNTEGATTNGNTSEKDDSETELTNIEPNNQLETVDNREPALGEGNVSDDLTSLEENAPVENKHGVNSEKTVDNAEERLKEAGHDSKQENPINEHEESNVVANPEMKKAEATSNASSDSHGVEEVQPKRVERDPDTGYEINKTENNQPSPETTTQSANQSVVSDNKKEAIKGEAATAKTNQKQIQSKQKETKLEPTKDFSHANDRLKNLNAEDYLPKKGDEEK